MSRIFYHIAQQADWQKALPKKEYKAPSLEEEGFIHASYWEQLEATAERYYRGEENLIVLKIDAGKLNSELRVERAPTVNQDFPHIYGPINTGAVVATTTYSVPEEGEVDLPEFRED